MIRLLDYFENLLSFRVNLPSFLIPSVNIDYPISYIMIFFPIS